MEVKGTDNSTSVDDLPGIEDKPKWAGGDSPTPSTRRKGLLTLKQIEDDLKDVYELAGWGISFRCPDCGLLVNNAAQVLAHSWVEIASENATVHKWLSNFCSASIWSNVLIIHANVAIPIFLHHGGNVSFMHRFHSNGNGDVIPMSEDDEIKVDTGLGFMPEPPSQ